MLAIIIFEHKLSEASFFHLVRGRTEITIEDALSKYLVGCMTKIRT